MAGMWHDLLGVPGYLAGTSGTVTVPAGACVIQIVASAGATNGSMTLFGGASIPIIANEPLYLNFNHDLFQANSSNGGAIVFTGTVSYFVHWVRQGNA